MSRQYPTLRELILEEKDGSSKAKLTPLEVGASVFLGFSHASTNKKDRYTLASEHTMQPIYSFLERITAKSAQRLSAILKYGDSNKKLSNKMQENPELYLTQVGEALIEATEQIPMKETQKGQTTADYARIKKIFTL